MNLIFHYLSDNPASECEQSDDDVNDIENTTAPPFVLFDKSPLYDYWYRPTALENISAIDFLEQYHLCKGKGTDLNSLLFGHPQLGNFHVIRNKARKVFVVSGQRLPELKEGITQQELNFFYKSALWLWKPHRKETFLYTSDTDFMKEWQDFLIQTSDRQLAYRASEFIILHEAFDDSRIQLKESTEKTSPEEDILDNHEGDLDPSQYFRYDPEAPPSIDDIGFYTTFDFEKMCIQSEENDAYFQRQSQSIVGLIDSLGPATDRYLKNTSNPENHLPKDFIQDAEEFYKKGIKIYFHGNPWAVKV